MENIRTASSLFLLPQTSSFLLFSLPLYTLFQFFGLPLRLEFVIRIQLSMLHYFVS